MPPVRKFVYQPRTDAQVRAQKNTKRGFDTFTKPFVKIYKPREGLNVIRILPPTWPNPSHWGVNLWVNYDIGPDKGQYISLRKTGGPGTPDPLDDARIKALRAGDAELAKKLTPKHRVCMWLIDRKDEDAGPQFYAAAFSLDDDFINASLDPDTGGYLKIDDDNHGYDLTFYKEKQGDYWTFPGAKIRLSRNPSPIHENEKKQQEWMNYIQEYPIPDCLVHHDFAYINAVFNGVAAPTEDEEGDPVEQPPFEVNPEPELETADDAASGLRARLAARRQA